MPGDDVGFPGAAHLNDKQPCMLEHLPTKINKQCVERVPAEPFLHDEHDSLALIGFTPGVFVPDNKKLLPHDVYIFASDDQPLGKGGFGVVHRAVHGITQSVRAIKEISKAHVKDVAGLRQEVQLVKGLDHPNIVRLCETFEDRNNLYLVMELFDGGEILQNLVSLGSPCPGFSEGEAGHIIRQVLRAVNYLGTLNIVHRDLKLENVMLVRAVDCTSTPLKLIDFGLATTVPPGGLRAQKGTKWYLAPEVLARQPYGLAVDMWACGVMVFMLLCGKPPFYSRKHPKSDDATFDAIQAAKLSFMSLSWANRSDDCKEFIKGLLKKDVATRAKPEEALAHPWLRAIPKPYNRTITSGDVTHMLQFFEREPLVQAACELMVASLHEYELKDHKDLFLSVDSCSRGMVNANDLEAAIAASGLSALPAAQQLLAAVRTRNITLRYTEFIAAAIDKSTLVTADRCRNAFRVFDRDLDGGLSYSELMVVFGEDHKPKHGECSGEGLLVDLGIQGEELEFPQFCAMMGLEGECGQPFVMDEDLRSQILHRAEEKDDDTNDYMPRFFTCCFVRDLKSKLSGTLFAAGAPSASPRHIRSAR
mmetsp:Transcript_11301/g.25033  ORF Transcript_11301/g.25033 Transcript_11301/m.25033 type:complete len:591 (+) Transcript_11301:33-1805(+)